MAARDQGFQDFVLLLPTPLRARAEEMASRESLSLNLFILMAIAEKLQRTQLQHCLGISERDELLVERSSSGNPLIH
ncbi:MAG TPA: hypothetical protein VGU25_07335 [Acidobacteriaceae bacterium]|nr:hypothetical protein [Acidobacteriaceae bacterium]